MVFSWLVNVILVLHFGFLAYLVLGGFLAWRWPRAIVPHGAAAIWGILIVLSWVDCPLTWAEDWARQRSGQAPLTAGFIDRYVTGVIYPPQYLHEARAAVAAMVLISWVGAFVLWRRRQSVTRALTSVGAPGGGAGRPADTAPTDQAVRSAPTGRPDQTAA